MKWSLALAAAPAHAFLRFGCSTLSVQRLDPVVQPGSVPSSHLHQIIGGNSFNATMDPTQWAPPDRATCTSCVFSENFSNYWTAVMFFRARNGSYIRVPQYPNSLLGNLNGGMTVYYIQADFSSNGNQKITAFKPGFRMTVGSPSDRSGKNPGLAYTCLQNVNTRFPETKDFPKGPCPAGIMAIHHFPNCWDGKNLDSPNHQTHMYYSGRGGFINAGACPASHPVRMPQLAFETMWQTQNFNNKADWPADTTKQPFEWSFIDNQGLGTHGDYLFGWKTDQLQKAMDDRSVINDAALKRQSVAQQNACTIKSTVNEPIDGYMTDMPGQKVARIKRDLEEAMKVKE